MNSKLVSLGLLAACLLLCTGCTGRVVRTITVESQPPGAILWLNDNEVGRTPVTVPFTWYGVYSIRMEKEGYVPLEVLERVAAPWYQWLLVDLPFETVVPGTRQVDLPFETVVPGTRRDRHHFGPYELEPAQAADPDKLLRRGEEFRKEAQEGLSLQ